MREMLNSGSFRQHITHSLTRLPIAARVALLLVAMACLCIGVSSAVIFYNLRTQVERLLGERTEQIARTAALLLDLQPPGATTRPSPQITILSPSQSDTRHLEEQLVKIQQANSSSSELTALIPIQNPFGGMQIAASTNQRLKPGTVLTNSGPAYRAFTSSRSMHTPLYATGDGTWLSAYAPLFDRHGTPVAVLELDYRADRELTESERDIHNTISNALLVTLGMAIALGGLLGERASRPLRTLARSAREIAQGNLAITINSPRSDEIGDLSRAFDQMIFELRRSQDSLREHLSTLEERVQERTSELQRAHQTMDAMLNSLGQGFLIFERGGICSSIYSEACVRLFGRSPAMLPFWELVGGTAASLGSWCEMLFDEPLPFSSLCAMGPSRVPGNDAMVVELTYHAVRNTAGRVSSVVVVATDRTAEVEASHLAETQRAYAERVVKVIQHRNQFITFLAHGRQMLERIDALLTQSTLEPPMRSELIRLVHTLKGGATIFSASHVASAAQELEGALQHYRGHTRSDDPAQQVAIASQRNSLLSAWNTLVQEMESVLGVEVTSGALGRYIALGELKAFAAWLTEHETKPHVAREFAERFLATPIKDSFTHFNLVIQEIAQRQGKGVEPLKITGGETKVICDPYRDLFSAFVHAFRNAVDHGIEDSTTREACAKPRQANIQLDFHVVTSGTAQPILEIQVRDDGAGIDPRKVRAKLEARGYSVGDDLDDQAIIQHVFDSGLSTRDIVTDLSGRGVGMDAIRDAARKLGGEAVVDSRLGNGTTLRVTVPLWDGARISELLAE